MRYVTCMIFASLLFSMNANAEGNCPPGQYPIGGQGAVGCAPIPQDNPEPPQPRPAGKWLKTWGAIADDGADDVGVSTDKLSRAEAENEALERCESASKQKCRVIHAYQNQCISVADPARTGQSISSFASGPSIEETNNRAIAECKKKNPGSECAIGYSNCTKQIFQRF